MNITDPDEPPTCPRCRAVTDHVQRRTRYGWLYTCETCGVYWLVPFAATVS